MDTMIILGIFTCLFVAGVVIVTVLHNQYRMDIRVERRAKAKDASLISVIVPARNEERNIRRCLNALLEQTHPNFEIIVVDDQSTDATAGILAEMARSDTRLHVVHGEDLPEGWAGKAHALYQGAKMSHGDWLCFVDADTFLAAEALASVLQEAKQQGADLFSIMTRQELGTFWEKTILPLVFTALSVGFSPRKVNDPSRADAIANGQFIFIKRNIYERVGGHLAIKDSIVEDKDLAVLIKRKGFRLVLADGEAIASTRMYTSMGEMWEGWTKNMFLGLRSSPTLLLLGAFGATVSLVAALALPAWMAGGLILLRNGSGISALVSTLEAAILWGYLIYWRMKVLRGMKVSSWYAFTVPIGAAFFAAMMIVSAWKVLSGRGVTWKGRNYVGR